MFDHLTMGVTNLDDSILFYDCALKPLGIVRKFEDLSADGRVAAYGRDRPQFWIAEGMNETPRIHIAFSASDREQVIEFHRAALEAGGRDNGKPGLRPHYQPGYYAAFLLDLDGNNIEAVVRE
jgi:catechol 2,3-dioxygenase-like lactoylglutathione lyase family enzyme